MCKQSSATADLSAWRQWMCHLAGKLSVFLSSSQVSIDCPWSIYSTVIALTFSVPFRTTHSLLSAGTR